MQIIKQTPTRLYVEDALASGGREFTIESDSGAIDHLYNQLTGRGLASIPISHGVALGVPARIDNELVPVHNSERKPLVPPTINWEQEAEAKRQESECGCGNQNCATTNRRGPLVSPVIDWSKERGQA